MGLPEELKEQLTAFLVGLITHLYADALMHPLIFYLTGPYDARDLRRRTAARQDHRMLETLIDMCLAGGYHRVRGHSLAAYIRDAEMPLLELHDHLDKTWLRDEDTERFAEGLLSLLPAVFLHAVPLPEPLWPGASPRFCWPSLRRRSGQVLALVYSPRLMDHCWRIEGAIPCRHPSTGEVRSQSIGALFQDAVDRSVEFCLGLEPVLGSGSSAPGTWSLPPVDPVPRFRPRRVPCGFSPREGFSTDGTASGISICKSGSTLLVYRRIAIAADASREASTSPGMRTEFHGAVFAQLLLDIRPDAGIRLSQGKGRLPLRPRRGHPACALRAFHDAWPRSGPAFWKDREPMRLQGFSPGEDISGWRFCFFWSWRCFPLICTVV
ncbi:MAG: zinc dependent phospholipase C family protein [Desulfosudis oleivorans]|nr:zinc dependent phospholipase C family protein [Desulfosudis oleivorans]